MSTRTYPTIADLMTRWDEMDNAAQRMLMALPSQMTEAAKALDLERLKTRAVLHAFCTSPAALQASQTKEGE